jgi:hypothetical protein
LRKFKRFEGDLAVFFTAPVTGFELKLGVSDAIAKLGALRCKRAVVDLLEQAQVIALS